MHATTTASLLAGAILLASTALACSVPQVSFYGDEAGGGGADATLDTGEEGSLPGDATTDAGGDDSSDALSDQGAAEGCPGAPPDDASVCCGPVVCEGDCGGTSCASCQSKCTATQLCCVRGSSVTCHTPGATCP